MLFEAVDGHVFGFLTYPMLLKEYFTCNDGDFDCNRAPVKQNWPYCDENVLKTEHPGMVTMHGVSHKRNVSRCFTNDIHMNAGPTVFIPTMRTWINQSWSEGKQEWLNDAITEVYMNDIESFLFRVQSSFRVDKLGLEAESVNLLGGVTLHNSSGCSIPCHSREGHPEDCALQDYDEHLPSCLAALPHSDKGSIFASKWGDTMTVEMLLKLAQIDLDSERPAMDGLTYRQSGGVVDIEVRYQNMDNYAWNPFGSHFLDTTVTYQYLVTPSKDFSGSSLYQTKVIENRDPHTQTRTLQRTTGIRIQLSTSGLVAGFKMTQCMTTLAVTTSLFAVAILVVESLLVFLYQKCGSKDQLTAAYMLKVYKEDESLDHAAFGEILSAHVPGAYKGYMEINMEENLYHEVARQKTGGKKKQAGDPDGNEVVYDSLAVTPLQSQ